MAASYPSPGITIPNYHRGSGSLIFPCPIWRSTIDKCRLMRKFATIQSVKMSPLLGRDGFGKKINVLGETESAGIEASNAEKDALFVSFFREAWPYFLAHRGSTFVVLISAEIIDSPHLDPILMDISLLHGLGIKFVLVPGTHVQIDRLVAEWGSELRYVGSYRITDPDSLDAAMNAAGMIRIMIQAKLSPGLSLRSVRCHGDNSRWCDGVSVASGNFLAAKRRGVVEGIDYASTGEVKKIDVSRIHERLDQDCIVLLSNLGYSSSGEVLNCNTYEVATACALALGAEKLICIIDGPILDECGRLFCFTLQDADKLIRQRAKQSETAANYVKAVAQEDLACVAYDDSNDKAPSPNGKAFAEAPKFQNGVGFDNGNGLWSHEQGFAIGGQERLSRLNGYLSELAAAAFVRRDVVHSSQAFKSRILGRVLVHAVATNVESSHETDAGTQVLRNTDALASTFNDVISSVAASAVSDAKTSRKERNPKRHDRNAAQNNMPDYLPVIRYPLATESAIKAILELNTLLFVVDKHADKKTIKYSVEKMFKITTKKVNTLIMPDGTKKAYVVLAPDCKALNVAKKMKIL